MKRLLYYILVLPTLHSAPSATAQVLSDFLPSALTNNPIAQYNASKCYAYGWGTDINPQRAAYFLRRSAEGAQPQAMAELAEQFSSTSPLLADYWRAEGGESRGNHYESYDNGCYYGETMSYQRDGYGSYAWDSGAVYSGEWQDGRRHGMGFSVFGDATHYGRYTDEPNGYGALIITNPEHQIAGIEGACIYVGDFVGGTPQGVGTLYDRNGTLLYYGNFTKGHPSATYPTTANYAHYRWAHESLPGGDTYEGESNGGIREGFGIYRWADGSVWFGEWEGGVRSGEGLYINANGAMMAGIWAGGELQE